MSPVHNPGLVAIQDDDDNSIGFELRLQTGSPSLPNSVTQSSNVVVCISFRDSAIGFLIDVNYPAESAAEICKLVSCWEILTFH